MEDGYLVNIRRNGSKPKIQSSRIFPDSSDGKESACSAGDPGLIPGLVCWRRDTLLTPVFLGFLGGSVSKESTCNVGNLDSIPGLGRYLEEGMATRSGILA